MAELRKAVIVDLDGTIALHQNRSPYNWRRCHTDLPNTPVVEVVRWAKAAGYEVLVCSGREEEAMDMSIQWMRKYDIPYDKVFMRANGDKRADNIIKEEIYNTHIRHEYQVSFVLDDRLRVCRMWHKLGLTLLRVGDPDADF